MRHKGLTGWRYNCKCNYLITLVTEPRRSIFGTLREWGVERTAEGKAVYDAWQAIERHFPGVRATYNAIMPDHFHGLVYVTADGVADLGDVVAFFAAESERRIGRRVWNPLWRDTVCLARGQLHRQINYILANPKRRWIKEKNKDIFRRVLGFSHWRLDHANSTLADVDGADSWDFRAFSFDPAAAGEPRELWDVETGAEIVKPRKANLLQRAFESGEGEAVPPPPPTCCRPLAVPDSPAILWTAMGNPFLLDAPLLISVRISTKTPQAELGRLVANLAEKAERGAVLVSPWISPGEKAAKAAAIACGGRVVQLIPEGMGRYYKPAAGDFSLCNEGRLLLLSPFAPRESGAGRLAYGKPRFEWLNLAASSIADIHHGFSRSQLSASRQFQKPAALTATRPSAASPRPE